MWQPTIFLMSFTRAVMLLKITTVKRKSNIVFRLKNLQHETASNNWHNLHRLF